MNEIRLKYKIHTGKQPDALECQDCYEPINIDDSEYITWLEELALKQLKSEEDEINRKRSNKTSS